MLIKTGKKIIKKLLRYPKPYSFKYSSLVQKQQIVFTFQNQKIVIEADGTTPLYETIAEIIEYDCYLLNKIDFSKFSKQSIALDIGGNIGIFSIVLAVVFPGKIICFEPIEDNCKYIEHNCKINNITNIEIRPEALCLKDEKLKFYKGIESVSGSCNFLPEYSVEEVNGVSVETIINQYSNVELIKSDCEGSEYEIIPEFLKLSKKIKYFSAEIHDIDKKRNLKKISQQLKESGYIINIKPELFERRGLHCLLATSETC